MLLLKMANVKKKINLGAMFKKRVGGVGGNTLTHKQIANGHLKMLNWQEVGKLSPGPPQPPRVGGR